MQDFSFCPRSTEKMKKQNKNFCRQTTEISKRLKNYFSTKHVLLAWAIFNVFGDKFSCKSRPNIFYEKYHFSSKNCCDYFWETLDFFLFQQLNSKARLFGHVIGWIRTQDLMFWKANAQTIWPLYSNDPRFNPTDAYHGFC